MIRRSRFVLFAAGVAGPVVAGAAVAGPPVQPPPAMEYKNGRWQVRAAPPDDGVQAYWSAAGLTLVFGAGLTAIVTGRHIGRARRAGLVGAGIGAAVGVGVVAVLGRPAGTPPVVGPAMVGAYAAFGALAGWPAGRERAAEVRRT